MLILRRNAEVRQDQRPHEDVVDTQALLDEVAAHVLAGRSSTERDGDHRSEGQTHRDPHRTFDGRLTDVHFVRFAVDDEDVEGEQKGDERQQSDPGPAGNTQVDEVRFGAGLCEVKSHGVQSRPKRPPRPDAVPLFDVPMVL